MKKKRIRNIPLQFRVTEHERELIYERMAEAGTINRSGFIRRMMLKGYVLNVDISPLHELVSLQRSCVNNLKQIAKHVDSPEIAALQKSYDGLWVQISEILKKTAMMMEL